MKKTFYILITLAVCVFLCVPASAMTDVETGMAAESVTEVESWATNTDTESGETVDSEGSTPAGEDVAYETLAMIGKEEGDASGTEAEKDYWTELWNQMTEWIDGHPEVIAFLTAAGGFIGSIIIVCKKAKVLIQMALALRREGDEKRTEAQEAITVSRKEMAAIAEEHKIMQERVLASEEKTAKAVAGMAWCVERLFEESNLPTYKKDEIRAKFNEAVGGGENEGTNKA